MINQIKDLIDDIENIDDKYEKYLKYTELSKLVLENLPSLESEDISNLRDEDMLSEVFYEYDEIGKKVIDFVSANIEFIEDDMKNSDFETELKNNTKTIEKLKQTFITKENEYENLVEQQQQIDKIQEDINTIEEQIKPYKEIDLDYVLKQQDELIAELRTLEQNEGENLKIYQQHLKTNEDIQFTSSNLKVLSSEIKDKLDDMDEIYKEIVKMKGEQ